MLFKKLSVIIVSLQLIILPVSAQANDEQVANLNEGEPAPFSGTLFTPTATARMLVELENASTFCDLKVAENEELLTARYDLQITNMQAALDSCNETCTTRLDIRQGHIDFLNQELAEKKPINTVLYFVAGTVLGVGITLGTSYAYANIVN